MSDCANVIVTSYSLPIIKACELLCSFVALMLNDNIAGITNCGYTKNKCCTMPTVKCGLFETLVLSNWYATLCVAQNQHQCLGVRI